ncbi:hypothetical protein A374_06126 [Fictibacillus macauensis ZFHKF-1]|uniref:Aminotransferase class I/classII large domain-containing protein n=1 Tax=Fictibacillus macauensis ZFHKF-1 TaxID=1196324 RepID=I8UH64_9BACL|nr:PLP-dependent aminotransferase family protein [Fictibacillus macauensis]EIT86153.1 hypothetical protein A374_06126 [Fictibacillus macauensis ZFHKF-1]
MNPVSFFPENIKKALGKPAPGAWMPTIPPACIRLSSGYPEPSLIPVGPLQQATEQLLVEEKDLPLHYIGSPRTERLYTFIQERMAQRGMTASRHELLITAGASQALDLIARILLDEEALVVMEAPTYMEAIEIFRNYTDQLLSVPIDGEGLQTEVLEALLQKRSREGKPLPQLLYLIPTFQNPTGTSMSTKRRHHVLQLALTYNFLILEDDAYGELAFGARPTSLKAMDTENRVLYVGSLSKVIAPGLRIGWMAGDAAFIKAAAWFKKDLEHPYSQALIMTLLENVSYEAHLKKLQNRYEQKCRVLQTALQEAFGEQASWYVPGGGYFLWLHVPGIDAQAKLADALKAGVSYIPGEHFFLRQEEGKEYVRLSFSMEDEAAIVTGVQRLKSVLLD